MIMRRQPKHNRNLAIIVQNWTIRLCFLVLVVLVALPSFSIAETTVGGTISTDTTWTVAGSPYIISSDVTVQGADGADGVTTLTIEPGTEVRGNLYRLLRIGGASGNPGALIAQGTSSDPIIFTSNQATPAAGDWYGIQFHNTAHESSTLEHCVIRYAGNYGGSINISNSSPTITSTTIENGGNYDLYYSGTVGGTVSNCTLNSGIYLLATSTVEFTGDTFNNNNDFPTKTYADYVGNLLTDNTFANIDSGSYLFVNSGNVTKDATWTDAIPIYVPNYLNILGTDGADSITTLTLQPGTELRFKKGNYFRVGAYSGSPGALVAQGTSSEPIVFTSNEPIPAAGDWYGIQFYNTAHESSTLDNCVIRYAGSYAGSGSIEISGSSPTISNTTIENGASYDLYYSGTVGGTVSNCTLNSGIYLIATSTVDFTGNTFNYNNAFPIKTLADNVGSLVTGNTYTNLDANSHLYLNSGNVTKDATWTNAIPIYVPNYLNVLGTDGADSITTLTLQPGAQLRFKKGNYLRIGASSGSPGALVALGTSSEPILFTSNEATPAAGDWYGIQFYTTAHESSTLEHCVMRYTGYYSGSIYIINSSPTITSTTIENGSNYDLYYTGTVGGTVSNCTFNSGIYLIATSTVDFTGNTFNYNPAFPPKTYADHVGSLVTGNTFTGLDANSHLFVNSGNVTRDATWTSAIPIYINSNTTVQGVDGTDGVTTLTIEPGAVIKFNQSTYLNVGYTSGNPGALAAQGTAEQQIIFTSNNASPSPGNWQGIRFYNTADDATSSLIYCIVEYAGYGSQGAVHVNQAKPVIHNSIISNNTAYGLYITGSGATDTDLQCNTFVGNGYGIFAANSAVPIVLNNNFNGNSTCGLYNASATTIVAEENWWGDPNGPNQTGDSILGNVDADPWSTAENNCVSAGDNNPPHVPADPYPADNAVRINIPGGVTLSWSGNDPDPLDSVTYDLYKGTAADNLALEASDLEVSSYLLSDPIQGQTYFWQVIARDNHGLETTGPVWCFTTNGDPPDLIISNLITDPAGNILPGQSVTLTATVYNNGSGPVVDSFQVDYQVDDTSLGSVEVSDILLAGSSIQLSKSWTYANGDPVIKVIADDQHQVSETNEENNLFSALLSEVADITAPALTGTQPSDSSNLQEVLQITFTLVETQGFVDDTAVINSVVVELVGTGQVNGSISEQNDTFTFTPTTSPLADGTYQVSLTATDSFGNSQGYNFTFTVDSQPPAKPVITGGTVTSGTIQARPVENISNQFVVELTGTRETDTRLWINGTLGMDFGDTEWSMPITLEPGDNVLEVWLIDRAGNQGESEWVDIEVQTNTGTLYEYDAAKRVKRIHSNP